ncbi:D-alanine--D-alanine ligase family protein [Actinoalloteichus caeruleus]|uniref:D-alanine--D-alanine ligase n=2 Tax=Actinoalloteichus cyanogriseus TaxID=2893586 RepID=A0ABT1JP17_ACTCY|nr:D-alanine--D-alanine ligase family protein [Actinoalloteichus caeruleus]MCP2333886.1 D-alanine-D-alanine ligase [Actinoalloteichus caeruleus DSM 43889]
MSEPRTRVAVVYGGRSGEHAVSRQSAASILTHLDRDRHQVVPVLIDRDGGWWIEEDGPDPAATGARAATEDVWRAPGPAPALGMTEALRRLRDVDVVFPALHGPFGEDGTIQSMLALYGIPFVGNGVLASAVGMDKEHTKTMLASAGIPVAPGLVLRPGQRPRPEDLAPLGLPLFVKPARAGSSLGVSRVDDLAQLPAALATARESDGKVLVEGAVPGREIDVGVLQRADGTLEVSPPLEIRVAEDQRFFDYEAKYDGSVGTVFDVPATLDASTAERLDRLAVAVFEALDCAGLLRVDVFLRADGELVVNEVNTFPGFTSASQYPLMWRAAGLSYSELLTAMVDTALARRTPVAAAAAGA